MAAIYIQTFGCALNQSDSEAMAGILEQEGHTIVEDADRAEVVVINSCTVKHLAEKKLFRAMQAAKDKRVIVAGCVPQADQGLLATRFKDVPVIGTGQLHNIGRAVEEALRGKVVHRLEKEESRDRVLLPVKRGQRTTAIIPINEGCMSHCTYCKTKQARGENTSYAVEDLEQAMRRAVDDGCKEIWLTSQDTGCYGLDIGTDLPSLLKKLLSIRGDYRVRVGMMNPTYAHIFLHDLLEVFRHPKMYKFLHIPVQSGNDRVLKEMARGYKAGQFVSMVRMFREAIPDITIATDVIVGFPTETEEEFLDTCGLVEEMRPEVLNISRFWLRPGTKAEQLPPVHGRVSKARSQRLNRLFDRIAVENNRKWRSWRGEVLVQEVTSPDNTIARNDAYRQVVIKDALEPGQRYQVRVVDTTRYDLRGEVVG